MPHQYSNFTSAYNAQRSKWASARTWWVNSNIRLNFATDERLAGDALESLKWTISAIWDTNDAIKYLADFFTTDYLQSDFMECFYWANKDVEAPEFDMDTLLSTMVSADNDQLKYFIGIVDAYRQSIWNKPFNAEFFAAIARGFE